MIRSSIDKFLKCGDVKQGFARVRCPDCGEEFFVAFSCRQRGCCPSCDQSRSVAETTLHEPGAASRASAKRRGVCPGSSSSVGVHDSETIEDIFPL
ncbi:MAG: transposase zinc-binding domain-containing protein [Chitinispirillaceae bacterium]|nr:transposase zinc-binding domain-containing protein [Chitinispirillaceae bacterium]